MARCLYNMVKLDFKGVSKVVNLLNNGVELDDIVDSYGRPLCEEANEFFSYHKQAKRMIIKKAQTDIYFRNTLKDEDI